jgi:hypothetical protein
MSQVKLVTSSGGSIALEPTNTSSNIVIQVPARTGTTVLQDGSDNLLMNSGYGSDAVAYGCRAWISFNGTGTPAILGSGNVSSLVDNGTGRYTVNFTNAMPDANYSAIACQDGYGDGTGGTYGATTGYIRVFAGTTPADATAVNVAVFR